MQALLSWRRALPAFCRILFDLALVPVAAAVLVGHIGDVDWLLDLTNFFRPHLAAVAAFLVVISVLAQGGVRGGAYSGAWRIAAAAVVFGFALYPMIVPSVPAAEKASVPHATAFRVLSANILGSNRDYPRFFDVVHSVQPDIIQIEEADTKWRAAIASLHADYPYLVDTTLTPGGGIFVASRYPMKTTLVPLRPLSKPYTAIGGSPPFRLEVTVPGATRKVVFYAVHPPTPRQAIAWIVRNSYLEDVAASVAAEAPGTQVIMAGDWNTPYWSPALRRFMAQSGLVTTERGAWPPPTRFFREIGAPIFLGTPIDRVAISPDIGFSSIKVGNEFGSDHLPVTVDLSLR